VATTKIFSAGEGHRDEEAILPVGRIGGGDGRRAYQVEILGIPGRGRGPIHRACKHDLTVDYHALAVGEPDTLVDPDRHPGTS